MELRLLTPVARQAQQPLEEARASLLLELWVLWVWKEQEALSASRPVQEFLSWSF